MNHRIRLLIVARNAPHRQMMRTWLAGAADITIVGEARDEPEALTLTGKRQPDVVLLGVETLGLDDLQTVARLHARYPHSKVVVFSRDGDQGHLASEALRGAKALKLRLTITNKSTSNATSIIALAHLPGLFISSPHNLAVHNAVPEQC